MLLSTRWKFLWTLVPKLVYDDHSYQDTEHQRFSRFVDRSLLLHKAPILEPLHFKVGHTCGGADIPVWIRAADKLSVRELVIEIGSSSRAILPRSLYTGLCRMLEILKLNNVTLVDFSSPVSFPSLRVLTLESVQYPGDEFVNRFLSSCPILEDLTVKQCPDDNVTFFTVNGPSLVRAYMFTLPQRNEDDIEGFYSCFGKIMSSLVSVENLQLCINLYLRDPFSVDNEFDSLESLEIGTCMPKCFHVLMCLLRASPNLKSLVLDKLSSHPRRNFVGYRRPRLPWIETSSVAECLSSSLETLKWGHNEGTLQEKQVAAFILRNGSCLKNIIISSKSTYPHL